MIEPFSGKVIEGCPYVDTVIPFEIKTIHTYSAATERGKFAGYLHYRRLIQENGYDAAFVLKRSLSSALLVFAAGVPRRIGFATEGRGLLLTDRVPYRQDQHEVENFLDCLRILDIPIASDKLELWPTAENDRKVTTLFKNAGWQSGDLKIVIHPAASLPAKQWPLERFAEIMKVLQERHKARFIYTGAKGDAGFYRKIEERGPFKGLDLCGQMNLRENISVYKAADLFFGVDSGPMHMAAAMGVPVVGLFGPTDERKWKPWGEGHTVITKRLSCYPCKPHKCDTNECMRRISVEEVLEVLERRISLLPQKV